MSYTANEIFPYLKRTFFLGLNTNGEQEINSRMMLFACSDDLKRFFFLTQLTTQKVTDIKSNNKVTLNILSTADKVEDYAQTIVKGSATLLTDYNDENVQEGFKLLMEKSSMIKMLYDSKTLGDYCMIKLDVSAIRFGVYSEILQGTPLTELKF